MLDRTTIDQYVKRLVDRFQPQSVFLFGSQAEGTATADSDVDLLVVMNHDKTRDVEQEIEIDRTLPRQFPLDILVRRLASHDMALVTIFKTGVSLYERPRNYA